MLLSPRHFFSVLVLNAFFWFFLATDVYAANTWQEPNCDPTVSPSTCNISAPLNVSSANQTKTGGLTISGTLTANNGFTLSAGTLSLPSNSVTDVFTSDTLTSSIFKRVTGGTTTDAVDLGSWHASSATGVEVVGTLPAGAITDNWVNVTGDSITMLSSGSAATALAVTPWNPSTANAVTVIGSTSQSLLLLRSDNNASVTEGDALSITVASGSAASGLDINSSTTTATAYPLDITINSAATATRGINVANGVTSTAATNYGVYSYSSGATTSVGVYGFGVSYGVQGQSSGSHGVYGSASGSTVAGVYGVSTALSNGYGVYGTSPNGYGVYGTTTGPAKAGVYGVATGSSANYGVQGSAISGFGGYFTGPTGVQGTGTSTGVYGEGPIYGVRGKNTGSGWGVYGEGSVYGVYGTGNYGVYGNSTTYYGGYFSGPTGLQAYATNGNAIEAYSSTPNKSAVYAESTGGGYGLYARTTSTTSTIGAVTGLNTGTTGYSSGGYFTGQIGVTGTSTGTDQNSYAVNGVTTAMNAPAIHGINTGTNGGYGVWGEANTGIGVYGKGKTYAAKFDGAVIGGTFLETQRPAAQTGSNMISSAGTYVAPTLIYFRNMVYDGSELWLLHNDYNSGQADYVYRYDPSTLFETRKYSAATADTYGVMSKLVAVPSYAYSRAVYYWDGAGNAYYYGKYDLNPTQANASGTIKQDVATGIVVGSTVSTTPATKIVLGTCTNYRTTGVCSAGTGTLSSTNLDITSYTGITYTGTIGGIIDFVSDKDQYAYALSDRAGAADEVLRISRNLTNVDRAFVLPYTAAQTAKDMLYDGRYIWVLMDRTGAESIVRIDPEDNTNIIEYFLTNDGASTGTTQCTGPIAMVYDDIYIWIGCTTLPSTYPGMLLFSPTAGTVADYGGNGYIEFSGNQKMMGEPVYDGTYIYVATGVSSTTRLRKYYSGHGPGNQTAPMVMGVNFVGTDGTGAAALYCGKVLTGVWQLAPGKCNGTLAGFSY